MGGSSGGTEIKGVKTLTPDQRSLLDQIVRSVSSQIGRGVDPYPGRMVAGLDPLQERGFELAELFGESPESAARKSAIARALSGQPGYAVGPEEYLRYFDTGVAQPVLDTYRREIIPELSHAYGSGGPSGALASALADSGKSLTTQLAGERARYALQGQQSYERAMESAAGRSVNAISASAQEEMRPIQMALSMGGMRRDITQDQLAGDFARWSMSQPYNNPWVQQYLGPALGTPTKSFYSSQQGSPAWLSLVSGILNPLGGMMGG